MLWFWLSLGFLNLKITQNRAVLEMEIYGVGGFWGMHFWGWVREIKRKKQIIVPGVIMKVNFK